MVFSDNLQHALLSRDYEKTSVDKLLGKDDFQAVTRLIKKDTLTRQDVIELSHRLSSTEAKLVQLDDGQVHTLAKFYTWIQEVANIMENFFDYQKQMQEKKNQKTEFVDLTPNSKKQLEHIQKTLDHRFKAMVSSYLHGLRTSLSVRGTGLEALTIHKFSMVNDHKLQNQMGDKRQ